MRKAIIIFILMALAQWLLPVWTIFDQQQILSKGQVFHFRTAPIDPHDPFRGEYVTLRFAIEDSLLEQPLDRFDHREEAIVILKEIDGEAVIDRVQREVPGEEEAWIRVIVNERYYPDTNNFTIDLPFDRYYLEEGTGLRTEEMVYRPRENEAATAHAVVRVYKGKAAIEDLVVGGRSIREIILEERLRSE